MKNANIAVIGLGYVGLPLLIEISLSADDPPITTKILPADFSILFKIFKVLSI